MNVPKIKMPIEIAKEEWKKYNQLLKKRKDKYLKDMKVAMYNLKQGKELLDIYVVMEKVGVNKNQEPKLAIARADWKKVYFTKKDSGRGFFSGREDKSWADKSIGEIDLPPETFQHWLREKYDIKLQSGKTAKADDEWRINKQKLKTKIPVIPAYMHPEGELKDYYILWEVDQWEDVPPKRDDPLLLKRITENLFVILGAWDVTELEQSIIRGLK